MVNRRNKKIKVNWKGFILDTQLIILAFMTTNCLNALNDGFSWAGLGYLVSGLLFVLMILYLRNTKW